MSEEDKNSYDNFERELKEFTIFKKYCDNNRLSYLSEEAHVTWLRQYKINEILEDGGNNRN